ncbi:hypothetical protein OROHE_012543 [Orobanche hederae]
MFNSAFSPNAAELVIDLYKAAYKIGGRIKAQPLYKVQSWDVEYLTPDTLRWFLDLLPKMLFELRTSRLSPHKYYELYLRAFDELRKLEIFFKEETTWGCAIVELYELVQHAGNILPRLMSERPAFALVVALLPDFVGKSSGMSWIGVNRIDTMCVVTAIVVTRKCLAGKRQLGAAPVLETALADMVGGSLGFCRLAIVSLAGRFLLVQAIRIEAFLLSSLHRLEVLVLGTCVILRVKENKLMWAEEYHGTAQQQNLRIRSGHQLEFNICMIGLSSMQRLYSMYELEDLNNGAKQGQSGIYTSREHSAQIKIEME